MLHTLFLLSALISLSFGSDKPLTCPPGIGATQGDAPKIVFSPNRKVQVVVCGFETGNNPETKHLSEFDVYSVRNAEFKKLFTASALEHFLVSVKKDLLILTELTWHSRKKWVPAFERKIGCTSANCTISSERCLFKKVAQAPKGAWVEYQRYESGDLKGKVPDERVISNLGELALSGDQKAFTTFTQDSPPIALDGASAEEFLSIKSLLNRLKKNHCL